MSALLLAAVVAGQAALVVAALTLSRVVQSLQVDARRSGPLVDRPDRRTPTVRPPDLERIERLVADAMTSDATAANQLRPLLAELGRAAPGGPVAVDQPPRDRRRWLAVTVTALEDAWRVDRTG